MTEVQIAIKRQEIISWIYRFKKNPSTVLLSDYCYNCFMTGTEKNKTLIAFPDEVLKKGIIVIDKPLKEVGIKDIIKLYTRIN